ncbi:MAG: formate dehydrogenase accessory sulfurtransferase FdhD [Thalassotalea sp.]
MTNSLKNISPATPNVHSVAKKSYRLDNDSCQLVYDDIIVEEPLQINLSWFNPAQQSYQTNELAVVMRTPGSDIELVTGLLFNEGIIKQRQDILAIALASEDDPNTGNQLEIELSKAITIDWQAISRSFASLSSCGICGKTSIKSLALKSHQSFNTEKNWLKVNDIPKLSQALSNQQTLFNQTGGVHGAAIFQADQWLAIHEDIGRHNAVDKVIGDLLQQNIRLNKAILLLTGRVSFELMQKAVMAAIPVVIAIGAPSSLAIAVAKQFDITLIGFNKLQQFNVYHGDWRLLNEYLPTIEHE